jgi:cytochrome c-type protein NapB
MKGRLFMIFIFILLFMCGVMIFGSAVNNNTAVSIPEKIEKQEVSLNEEGGVFALSDLGEKYQEMPEGSRTMKDYYNNRAYHGAPPMITHPLISEKGIGGKACLQCHQNGGYVTQFEAFAPVTPHPDWLNCRQCHLPMEESSLFKNTDWVKPAPPELGNQALSTSPMVMPHGIKNRENCLACHAGPAAPEEIRVTHPERINCRQCHVLNKTENIFFTPVDSRNTSFLNSDFIREEANSINESKQK